MRGTKYLSEVMEDKLDKIEEENYNNFGSKMVIVGYRKAMDIDVYFPEYDWTFKHTRYYLFKNGQIRCPYERRVYNIGYIGEGKYKAYNKNGKSTKCYNSWKHMLRRCYDSKLHKKFPTYKNCKVCNEWLNFQNFAKWYYNNYYEVNNEIMCLDKDILNKGNKIYSPNNCIFVPNSINVLFTKNDIKRGDYPIGVSYYKANKKFVEKCSIYNYEENKKKSVFLGYYDTPQKAFEVYKEFKESHIKDVAEVYKEQIPDKLYKGMYDYKVEVSD